MPNHSECEIREVYFATLTIFKKKQIYYNDFIKNAKNKVNKKRKGRNIL